jgi:SHS2 domain-containing protein
MQSLLFAFLDELLFLFHTESLVVRQLRLRKLNRGGNSDPEHPWALTASASGSRFVPGTHEPGTEVKAITYSAMQILERERADVYVIVDI